MSNLQLATHGPVYLKCLILINHYLHCQIQICMSCLFGETGASIILANKGKIHSVAKSGGYINIYWTYLIPPTIAPFCRGKGHPVSHLGHLHLSLIMGGS